MFHPINLNTNLGPTRTRCLARFDCMNQSLSEIFIHLVFQIKKKTRQNMIVQLCIKPTKK